VICSRPALRKAAAKNLAAFVKNIWQRICVTGPSPAGAVFYLLLYLWCLGGGVALSVLFFIITRQRVYHAMHAYLPFDKPDINLMAGLIVYVFPMLLAAIVAIFVRLFGRPRPPCNDRPRTNPRRASLPRGGPRPVVAADRFLSAQFAAAGRASR